MTVASREQVRRQYSHSGRRYDDHRVRNPRGSLLGAHDVGIFQRLLPDDREGMRVLEVGAGTGRFTLPAVQMGFRLTASDVNQVMLATLRAKLAEQRLEDRCRVGVEDVFALSFPDHHFDLVFSVHVIPRFLNLQDQRAALLELSRVVKPGGTLLFNYRNRPSLYGWLYQGHAMKLSQLRLMLGEAGMEITALRAKHLLSRKLLDRLPLAAGKLLSVGERALERVLPGLGWDVFLTAVKRPGSHAAE